MYIFAVLLAAFQIFYVLWVYRSFQVSYNLIMSSVTSEFAVSATLENCIRIYSIVTRNCHINVHEVQENDLH